MVFTPYTQFASLRQGTMVFMHPEFQAISGATHLPCLDKGGTMRPCVYLGYTGNETNLSERICWFVPISSKLDKYRAIYAYKTSKYGRCDTLTECTVIDAPRMVLFQNMFPATLNFIKETYKDKEGNDISLGKEDLDRVLAMASAVLSLVRNKGVNLMFDNPDTIISRVLSYSRRSYEKETSIDIPMVIEID